MGGLNSIRISLKKGSIYKLCELTLWKRVSGLLSIPQNYDNSLYFLSVYSTTNGTMVKIKALVTLASALNITFYASDNGLYAKVNDSNYDFVFTAFGDDISYFYFTEDTIDVSYLKKVEIS